MEKGIQIKRIIDEQEKKIIIPENIWTTDLIFYNASTDKFFSLLRMFHVELGSPHRFSNWTLYLEKKKTNIWSNLSLSRFSGVLLK